MKPANLAGEAWDGVRTRAPTSPMPPGRGQGSGRRVSMALGAFALFLAREPLKRTVTRLFADDEEESDGRIVTRIETESSRFKSTAPIVDASVKEGAN
jgi:hypothetical protein